MWEIWVQWEDGNVECIDEAEGITEANGMVQEYTMAFKNSAQRVWKQRP